MQDAHLAETRQSFPIRPQHPQLQRQNQQFEGRENFDYDVDRKTGWRYYREPRGNPPAASSSSTSQWPTSQWQTSWSSCGCLHHLRNVGDFGFLERIPEKRRGVVTGDPLTKHICATQSVHKRGTHTTRLAQVTRIAVSSLCA